VFQRLKQAVAEAPVLTFPSFTEEFIITTNTSADPLGVIFMQIGLIGDDGREHLLAKRPGPYQVSNGIMSCIITTTKKHLQSSMERPRITPKFGVWK
jgi:hypothetical protein